MIIDDFKLAENTQLLNIPTLVCPLLIPLVLNAGNDLIFPAFKVPPPNMLLDSFQINHLLEMTSLIKSYKVEGTTSFQRSIVVNEQWRKEKQGSVYIGANWHNILRYYKIINASWKVETGSFVQEGTFEEKPLQRDMQDLSELMYFPLSSTPQSLPFPVRIKLDVNEAFINEGVSLMPFIFVIHDNSLFTEIADNFNCKRMALTLQDGITQISCTIIYYSVELKTCIIQATLPKVYFGGSIDNAFFLYADNNMDENPRISLLTDEGSKPAAAPYKFMFIACPTNNKFINAVNNDEGLFQGVDNTSFVQGTYYKAIDFSQGHVTFQNVIEYSDLLGLTIEVLAYINSGNEIETLVMKGDARVNGWRVAVNKLAGTLLYSRTYNGTFVEWSFNISLLLEKWIFIVLSHSSVSDPILYINGTIYNPTKQTFQEPLALFADGTEPLTIGARKDGAGWTEYFNGRIEITFLTPFIRSQAWCLIRSLVVAAHLNSFLDIFPNASFENGFLNWTDSTGLESINTSDYLVGMQAANMSQGTLSRIINTIPGNFYKFSAWIKSSNKSRLYAKSNDIILSSPDNILFDDWEFHVICFQASSNSIEVGIEIIEGTVIIDRTELCEEISNLIDGNFQYNSTMLKIWKMGGSQVNNLQIIQEHAYPGSTGLLMTKDTSDPGYTLQRVGFLTIGEWYRVDASICSSSMRLVAATQAGVDTDTYIVGVTNLNLNNSNFYEKHVLFFQATENIMYIGVRLSNIGVDGHIDSIKIHHLGTYDLPVVDNIFYPPTANSSATGIVWDAGVTPFNGTVSTEIYYMTMFNASVQPFGTIKATVPMMISNTQKVTLYVDIIGKVEFSILLWSSSLNQGVNMKDSNEYLVNYSTPYFILKRSITMPITLPDAQVMFLFHNVGTIRIGKIFLQVE